MWRYLLLFILASSPALATPAQEAFDRLNGCLQRKVLPQCRQYVTTGSIELYDRFDEYGFGRCLPQQATYLSEEPMGEYVVVHAGARKNDRDQPVRLAFMQEGGEMKLDVPMSMQLWLGDNWQSRIDAAEKLYLLMRQQFGAMISCDTAQSLIK